MAHYLLLVVLVLASIFDMEKGKIPNYLLFPSMVAGFLFGIPSIKEKFLGFLLWFLIGAILRGIGAGDIKLLIVIQLFLGFLPSVYIFGIANVIFIFVVILSKQKKEMGFPLAPFLLLGTLLLEGWWWI